MSLPAILWALYEAPTSDPTETLVLIALGEHANDEGKWAWPSAATIGKKARCSQRTAERHLAGLRGKGLIREQPGAVAPVPAHMRPVVYELAMHRKRAIEPTDNLTGGTHRQSDGAVTGDADGPSPVTDEPVQEPTTQGVEEPEGSRARESARPAAPGQPRDLPDSWREARAAVEARRPEPQEAPETAAPPSGGPTTPDVPPGQASGATGPFTGTILGRDGTRDGGHGLAGDTADAGQGADQPCPVD